MVFYKNYILCILNYKKTLAGCFGQTMVLQIVSGVTSSAALEIYKNHQLRLLKGHQQILSFGWAFKERKRTKIRKVLMGF
ncbi:unnamed protein product [Rhizophagus irregularis]|nr:unnamed protein product [Rhizophagus irregularis]